MRAHYPWPQYRATWTVEVGVEIDGQSRQDLINSETRRIELSAVDGWELARFTVSTATTEKSPANNDESAMSIMSIPRTNSRFGASMAGATGSWSGAIDVYAHEAGGTAELTIVVLDAASRKIIANGDTWVLVCDAGDAPPRAGIPPFDTTWENFASSERTLLRQRARPTRCSMSSLSGRCCTSTKESRDSGNCYPLRCPSLKSVDCEQ